MRAKGELSAKGKGDDITEVSEWLVRSMTILGIWGQQWH